MAIQYPRGPYEPTHTRGPWEIRPTQQNDSAFVSDIHAPYQDDSSENGTSSTIATIHHRNEKERPGRIESEAEANARLIAAAPDLLEALIDAKDILELSCSDTINNHQTDVTVCLSTVQIAIAKAVGIEDYFYHIG